MTLLLAVNGWDPAPWLARFRAAAGDMPVVHHLEPHDPASIRYVACWKPPPGLIAALPHVELIINLGAGVDALLADPSLPDVPLLRVVDPDLTARMVEYVTLQVLWHHRRMDQFRDAQGARRWLGLHQPAAAQVRVGILGLGNLGQAAAKVLTALGFQVAGWSRRPQLAAGIETYAGARGLPDFLARTDILVALLPLTTETRGILNAGLFRQLARDGALGGPVLINAGRGGLQVEADILAALDDGTLRAASLDVFETEPLPASSPLWDHPRVVVTPHNAADSDPDALTGFVFEQIRRHRAGLPLENVVDRRAGY